MITQADPESNRRQVPAGDSPGQKRHVMPPQPARDAIQNDGVNGLGVPEHASANPKLLELRTANQRLKSVECEGCEVCLDLLEKHRR
jgi:hypothetical protein